MSSIRPVHLLGGILVIASIVGGCGPGAAGSATATAPPTPASASPSVVVAPSSAQSSSIPAASTAAPSTSPSAVVERVPAAYVTDAPYHPAIDPASFTTIVTNPYFPLTPGTEWTFDGGGEHVVVTVTHATRAVGGITALVVHDQGFEGQAVVEDTEDYYAQDAAGNVWYLGETTGECEGKTVTSTAGSWLTGVDGAQPGIVMLAQPKVGDVYRQEYLAGEAEDQATILKLDGTLSGPLGDFADVIVTEEVTPLEPDVLEHKSYAQGLGIVQEETLRGGSGVVRLTTVRHDVTTPDDPSPFRPCQG